MWSNTRRGAQFLDGTVPRLIRAIEKLTAVLESAKEEKAEKGAVGEDRICSILDLSTSHVKGPNPDWGDLRALEHAHGWIVYVSPDAEDVVPDWFRPIHEAAVENKCLLVNFDSAADTTSCFETWEWPLQGMVKPPGHTCPSIDKAQKQMRRLAWRARRKIGGYHDVDEVLQKGLKALEDVREENTQMRSSYYSMKEELDELRRE